jgi:hypothetical protein
MKTYIVTAKAGQMVAGHNNRGVGSTLTLSEEAARAAVEAGHLRQMADPVVAEAGDAENPDAAKEPAAKPLTKAQKVAQAKADKEAADAAAAKAKADEEAAEKAKEGGSDA